MKFQAHYSIKDLEKLSGIKAHTLRIWEKRYALFEPGRTETNIRHYSNDDLKRILNISLLNKHGFKISAIAAMRETEIAEKVEELNLVRTGREDLVDKLIVSMIEMDEVRFDKVFSAGILHSGFEQTIQVLIFPFFKRIGIMWQTGGINPAQEHFVSNIIRQKLIVAIDGLQVPVDRKKPTVVLFLPENELHEMSLLFYHYALRSRGVRTVYLGQTVPLESLARVVDVVRPDYLVSVITNPFGKKDMEAYMQRLAALKGVRRVLLSGKAVMDNGHKLPARIAGFPDLAALLGLLRLR